MIIIRKEQQQEIIDQAKLAGQNEGCGILVGKNNRVEKIYKMTNTSDSPATCYFMDPLEQLQVQKEIRQLGLELIGIFHSHPSSSAYPSKKDVELAFYPEVVYVIISLQQESPVLRAFRITEGTIKEEEVVYENR